MLARLILVFTLVPILELAILIQVGRWVGLWPTLVLVIGTGVVGAALTRHEGLRAWRAFQRDVWEGRMPGRPILDGLAIFSGGALLLTPGLLTDLLGFALLVPASRRWIQNRLLGRVRRLASEPDRHIRIFMEAGQRPTAREREEREANGEGGREIGT